MKNKIDLVELLKYCPKGMELDCPIFDDNYLEFDDIVDNEYLPIRCRIKDSNCGYNYYNFTKHGCWFNDNRAKCVIFPKGKATWEDFVPPYKFKDGDVIYVEGLRNWVAIVKSCNDNAIYEHVALENNAILHFSDNLPLIRFSDKPVKIRLATEEEKKKLFDAIKDNGYKWNSETKTLETLPKFKIGDKIIKKNGLRVPFVITGVSDVYYWSNTENSVEVLRVAEQDD